MPELTVGFWSAALDGHPPIGRSGLGGDWPTTMLVVKGEMDKLRAELAALRERAEKAERERDEARAAWNIAHEDRDELRKTLARKDALLRRTVASMRDAAALMEDDASRGWGSEVRRGVALDMRQTVADLRREIGEDK